MFLSWNERTERTINPPNLLLNPLLSQSRRLVLLNLLERLLPSLLRLCLNLPCKCEAERGFPPLFRRPLPSPCSL